MGAKRPRVAVCCHGILAFLRIALLVCQDKLTKEMRVPLVRIDVTQGRGAEQLRGLSQGIHNAIVAEFGIPERDYFHVLTEHPVGQIVAQDAGLGFERTPDVVMIRSTPRPGEAQSAKQSLFAAIADRLAAAGVAGEDVFIGYVENTAGDWSFGFGQAQYVTGELGVPAR